MFTKYSSLNNVCQLFFPIKMVFYEKSSQFSCNSITKMLFWREPSYLSMQRAYCVPPISSLRIYKSILNGDLLQLIIFTASSRTFLIEKNYLILNVLWERIWYLLVQFGATVLIIAKAPEIYSPWFVYLHGNVNMVKKAQSIRPLL